MEPPDRKWQYLLFAAEPYETIAFKVFANTTIKTQQENSMVETIVKVLKNLEGPFT